MNEQRDAAAVLTRILEHHRWANLRIVEACRALSAEQLNTAVEGTSGGEADGVADGVEALANTVDPADAERLVDRLAN